MIARFEVTWQFFIGGGHQAAAFELAASRSSTSGWGRQSTGSTLARRTRTMSSSTKTRLATLRGACTPDNNSRCQQAFPTADDSRTASCSRRRPMLSMCSDRNFHFRWSRRRACQNSKTLERRVDTHPYPRRPLALSPGAARTASNFGLLRRSLHLKESGNVLHHGDRDNHIQWTVPFNVEIKFHAADLRFGPVRTDVRHRSISPHQGSDVRASSGHRQDLQIEETNSAAVVPNC